MNISQYLILFIFLLNINVAFAQPDTVNAPVVRYDMNNKVAPLNKPFPFDQSFSVQIVNVPPTSNSLKVEIREIKKLNKIIKAIRKEKKDNPPRSPNEKGISNEEIFKKLDPGYVHRFSKDQISDANTIEFLQIGFLRPNTNYILDIQGIRNLDDKEKKAFQEYLQSLPLIENIINKIVDKTLNESNSLTSLSFLTSDLETLNAGFEEAIKNYNSSYQFSEFESESLNDFDAKILVPLAAFTTSLANFKKKFNKFYIDASDSLKDKSKAVTFSDKSQSIDWMNFIKGSPKYTELLESLNAMITEAKFDPDDYPFNRNLNDLITDLDQLKTITKNYLSATLSEQHTTLSLAGTYFRSATANARTYLSFDLGIGVNRALNDKFTYGGINIYFRPINRSIPLRQYNRNNFFLARTSLLVGVTFDSVDADSSRRGFIGKKAGLLGVGFRALPWLKVNYARMIYFDVAPNPLVSKKSLTSDSFFSLSIDANLGPVFKNLIKTN